MKRDIRGGIKNCGQKGRGSWPIQKTLSENTQIFFDLFFDHFDHFLTWFDWFAEKEGGGGLVQVKKVIIRKNWGGQKKGVVVSFFLLKVKINIFLSLPFDTNTHL